MKFFIVAVALVHAVSCGHVAVRMPFLNPAGVTYTSYGQVPSYDYGEQALAYGNAYAAEAHAPAAYAGEGFYQNVHHQQVAVAKAPVAVGYAQVPVKAAVAVPTVQHVPAVADVPYTKIEAQPAVVQKIVDVAKPAIKTRKYEIRRPAIQKQFYDIEERTIIRPVGSALVELEEPLSKAQKGPSIVSSLDGHQHAVVDDHEHHEVAVAHSGIEHGQVGHASLAYAPLSHAPVAVTPAPHTVAITPISHTVAVSPSAHTIAITPAPHHNVHYEQAAYVDSPYLHKKPIAVPVQHVTVSSTASPLYATPEPYIVSSTPTPLYADDSIAVEAAARNAAAHDAAVHNAAVHNAALHNAAAHEAALRGEGIHGEVIHGEAHLGQVVDPAHYSHSEAQENQQKLIKLLTAKGGVAEVGFGRAGHAEHVGDAGFSKARVLSATPSPYHEPVEEKVNTRRVVVSKAVHTLQEIDVVEPATKIEQVAINTPTYIKTARVGVQRVQTSVPVYGKALAPAIAHAQVPVSYYH